MLWIKFIGNLNEKMNNTGKYTETHEIPWEYWDTCTT